MQRATPSLACNIIVIANTTISTTATATAATAATATNNTILIFILSQLPELLGRLPYGTQVSGESARKGGRQRPCNIHILA